MRNTDPPYLSHFHKLGGTLAMMGRIALQEAFF
jgi:hypothetical protein